eukprot:jgi/Botrbrau1/10473/Bobra.0133s0079.1
MALSKSLATTAVLGLLTIVNFVTIQGQDCEIVLQGLAGSPTCANLQDNTKKVAGSAASGECATVKKMLATYSSVPGECCPALRSLVVSGCGCQPTFPKIVAAMGGISDIAEAQQLIKGTAYLIQEGACADAKFGGKVFNPCDGSVGVCAASRRKLY